MATIISVYARTAEALSRAGAMWCTGLLARLVFAATLGVYYLAAAGTKTDGLSIKPGAFAQIVPPVAEAASYDPSAIALHWHLLVGFGTLAEYALPALLVIGLLTRPAAACMIIFVLVQSFVDLSFHGSVPGALFDRQATDFADQRLLWIFPLLVLVLQGPGALSLDGVLGRLIGRPGEGRREKAGMAVPQV
jgi:putative oxidoreductase